jgi:gas vesicle protein
MELEPRQRNALIIGALVGAILGAGAGWLLAQQAEEASDEPRKPIGPGDVLKFTNSAAGLLRQLDELRQRM